MLIMNALALGMSQEIDLALHQAGDEMDIAREPVELGDDQLGAVLLAGSYCLGQLGAIGTLAALHLGELGHEPPLAAVEIVLDGLALRIDAVAGDALLLGRDP